MEVDEKWAIIYKTPIGDAVPGFGHEIWICASRLITATTPLHGKCLCIHETLRGSKNSRERAVERCENSRARNNSKLQGKILCKKKERITRERERDRKRGERRKRPERLGGKKDA